MSTAALAVQAAPEVDTKVQSLTSILSDSAAENSRPQPAPVKRHKGGRPRKDGKPRKSDLEMFGQLAPAQSAAPAPGPDAQAQPGQVAEAFEIPRAALKPALQFPFNLLRAKTGFEGFQLPDADAEEMVPLLDQVCRQYFPQVDPKHAPAVLLAGTLLTLLTSQTMAYMHWKQEHRPSAQKSPAEVTAPAQDAPDSARAFPTEFASPGAGMMPQ